MTRNEHQAQVEHPRLYALQRHGFVRLLGSLFWTPRALRTARKHANPPRAHMPYTAATTPKMIVVHIHEGAIVHF